MLANYTQSMDTKEQNRWRGRGIGGFRGRGGGGGTNKTTVPGRGRGRGEKKDIFSQRWVRYILQTL